MFISMVESDCSLEFVNTKNENQNSNHLVNYLLLTNEIKHERQGLSLISRLLYEINIEYLNFCGITVD